MKMLMRNNIGPVIMSRNGVRYWSRHVSWSGSKTWSLFRESTWIKSCSFRIHSGKSRCWSRIVWM